jgi:hypothetical protein
MDRLVDWMPLRWSRLWPSGHWTGPVVTLREQRPPRNRCTTMPTVANLGRWSDGRCHTRTAGPMRMSWLTTFPL